MSIVAWQTARDAKMTASLLDCWIGNAPTTRLDSLRFQSSDRLPSNERKWISRVSRWQREIIFVQQIVGPAPAVVRESCQTAALTKTIPIVCPFLADPVRLGLIVSMSRPGGNVTGVLFRTEGLVGKQLELALQLIPSARKIGFLVNVAGTTVIDREELESARQNVDAELVTIEVRAPDDLDAAFHAFANKGVQAVIVPDTSESDPERTCREPLLDQTFGKGSNFARIARSELRPAFFLT